MDWLVSSAVQVRIRAECSKVTVQSLPLDWYKIVTIDSILSPWFVVELNMCLESVCQRACEQIIFWSTYQRKQNVSDKDIMLPELNARILHYDFDYIWTVRTFLWNQDASSRDTIQWTKCLFSTHLVQRLYSNGKNLANYVLVWRVHAWFRCNKWICPVRSPMSDKEVHKNCPWLPECNPNNWKSIMKAWG